MEKLLAIRGTIVRHLRRIAGDRRGISAIEFALILPIIIALVAASEDFGQALMVDRKMSQIAATASGLAAEQSTWTTSNLDALISGTSTIIQPFPNGSLTIVVAALNVDASLNTKVAWSRAYNGTAWTVGSVPPVSISKAILQNGVQMVVAQATYSLTTPFASLLKPVTGLSSYSYTRIGIDRPRVSNTITLSGS